jgi:hypothetical protein
LWIFKPGCNLPRRILALTRPGIFSEAPFRAPARGLFLQGDIQQLQYAFFRFRGEPRVFKDILPAHLGSSKSLSGKPVL